MTYEEVCNAFQALYPTEFKHVVAELRAAEAEAKLAELEADDDDSD